MNTTEESTKIVAQSRKGRGSADSRRLRRKGLVPGVIMQENSESRAVQIVCHDLEQMLHHHASENIMLDLDVEGKGVEKVLVRDIQRDPLTDNIIHVDFSVVSMTKKMRVKIPVKLIGEPVGVSQNGGVLEHLLREVEVECLPGDLIEEIKVDVSSLNIGDSILVKDLNIGSQFTVITGQAVGVTSVQAPRLEEEEEKPAEVVEEGAEPEIIGKKEKETDEETEKKEKKEVEKGAEKKGKE